MRGMYELKKDLYKEYNPFFYHYTRSDLSKSEETQRKRAKADPSEEGEEMVGMIEARQELSVLIVAAVM